MQLANEHFAQQKQLGIQQQQANTQQQGVQQQGSLVPSEIAKNEAATGQAQAETTAIPRRLDLQQKEIDATLDLKKATEVANQQYRMGMLGVAQTNADTKALNQASQDEYRKFQALWGAKLDSAKIGGIAGSLQLQREALSQKTQFEQEENDLRSQANSLRAMGLNLQADTLTQRADDIVNKIGILRNVGANLGLAPKVEIPPQAGQPSTSTNPARKAAPPSGLVTVTDPTGKPHVFANQAGADAFKKEIGMK